jgi:beta-galactosidase
MQKTAQASQGWLISTLVTAWVMASGSVLGHAQGASTTLHSVGGNQQSKGLRFQSSLNPDWRFKRQSDPGAATEAEFVGAEKPGYDDSGWTKIALPHPWDAAWDCPFPTSRHFRGVGWYRRWFDVPADWQARRVAVDFKGVFQLADVWVNGKVAGRHVGGFTGFQFDVTDLLRLNGPNLLAVRVEDVLNPEIAPANETNVVVYGGIYRSVSLKVTDLLRVAPNGTWATTEGNADAPVMRVRTWIENNGKTAASAKLKTLAVDDANRTIATLDASAIVAPGETKEFDQKTDALPNAHLWSPDTPYLYRVMSMVSDGNRATDRYVTTFGIRFITVDPAVGFVLNGNPINLHGVDRRQD